MNILTCFGAIVIRWRENIHHSRLPGSTGVDLEDAAIVGTLQVAGRSGLATLGSVFRRKQHLLLDFGSSKSWELRPSTGVKYL